MSFFDFLDSGVKINTAKSGIVKEYIIAYPQKKGKSIEIGPYILNNLLKEDSLIIHIDTSLSFTGTVDIKSYLRKLKNRLTDLSINFEYRVYKKGSQDKNPLSKIFSLNKSETTCENIIFVLPQGFKHEELIECMLGLGCYVYCPVEKEDKSSLVQRILNGHFQYDDTEDKYSIFKFIMFMSSIVKQASLKTASLGFEDVKKLCQDL